MGSICLGSLIMTIVMILRFIVDTIVDGACSNNPAGKCIACCIKCIMKCIEDVVEYLTKTAYSYMAITGQAFCNAGKNGFLLNLKHGAKFYFAVMLAHGFVGVGTFFVFIVNLVLTWLMTTHISKESEDPEIAMWAVWIAAVIISYVVPMECLANFDEAVIAVMQSYGVDADLHHGKPVYGPKSYHEKLDAIEREAEAEKAEAEEEGGENIEMAPIEKI